MTFKKQEPYAHIRWMIRRDMPEVLQIETASFEFPWSVNDFVRALRQRNCAGMTVEYQELVIGFMIYELLGSGIHILNFAVSPPWQRLGIGSQMIGKLVAKISGQKRKRIFVEIQERNLPAQLFFRKCDFLATAIAKNYYQCQEVSKDANVMEFRIDSIAQKEKQTQIINPLAC